jgi:hypothetical protein
MIRTRNSSPCSAALPIAAVSRFSRRIQNNVAHAPQATVVAAPHRDETVSDAQQVSM